MTAEIFKFLGTKRPEKGKQPEVNLTDKLVETLDFLALLAKKNRAAVNFGNINERQKMLATWDDDMLRAELMQGNRLKWKEKPSWYHAVIQELKVREVIKSARPK